MRNGFVFHPDDTDTVFGYSHFGRGLVRSTDGGRTWVTWGDNVPWERIFSFAILPGDPARMFMGTEHGVHLTEDQGVTWSPFMNGLGEGNVRAMVVTPANPPEVFAGTQASDGTGDVHRLSGDQWEVVLDGGLGVSSMVASPNALYVAFDFGPIFAGHTDGTGWVQIAYGQDRPQDPDIPSTSWTNLAIAPGNTVESIGTFIAVFGLGSWYDQTSGLCLRDRRSTPIYLRSLCFFRRLQPWAAIDSVVRRWTRVRSPLWIPGRSTGPWPNLPAPCTKGPGQEERGAAGSDEIGTGQTSTPVSGSLTEHGCGYSRSRNAGSSRAFGPSAILLYHCLFLQMFVA